MVSCPFCSKNMESLSNEDFEGYPDAYLYFCQSCQLEQVIRWDTGERYLVQKSENGGFKS